MVLHHIRKIRNPHVRRATYGVLSLHGIFLSLVAIKTAIFHIARLKAVVYGSAAMMSLLDFIPHVTFAQALPSIDYSISNSTYPVMTLDGQMITYMYYYQIETLPYTPGSSVVVSANIPAGMTYHSHEGPAYASLTANNITWNIPSNQSRFGMILLRLMVSPDAYGPLTNTVTLTHANPDPVMTNNTASAVVIANTSAPGSSNIDLAITKTVNRTTATLMDDIVFTIDYINNGSGTAEDVKVYEVLPPSLYIVSRTEPTSPTINNNLYTRSVGNLAPGQGGRIVLRTSILPRVTNGSTIINYAVISANVAEANINNNSAEVAIQVQDVAPNMDINITAPKTTICLNETVRFNINVLNQGISDAPSVSVKHNKPSTLSWVSSSKQHVTPLPSAGEYVWNYATTFVPGTNASITMDLKGLSLGMNQAVPVKVFSNGTQYAQDTIYVNVVPDEICNTAPDPILGCTNPSANNYNPLANKDNNSCTYTGTGNNESIPGCTNPSATNYNANATTNNGTCTFAIPGCTNSAATNYNANATVNNGTCIMPQGTGTVVTGCMNPAASNYNAAATVSSGYCQFPTNTGTNTTTTGTNTTTTGANTTTTGANTTTRTGTTSTGTTTGLLILPKASVAVSTKSESGVVAKPSTTQFFGSKSPAPKKPETQKIVKDIKEAVATQKITTITEKEIPVTCESNMVEIYKYAKENELIQDVDVPKLCQPITRARLAELMVTYALKLALVEPTLERRCTFSDVASYNNSEKFYIALSCDFGFLGVNNDGTIQKDFRPGALVNRAEFAVTASRFLFGDTLKAPLPGQTRYGPSMQALYDSYVMKQINNPMDNILLGHVLSMMRRIDVAELLQNTKYVRLREKETQK